MSIGSRIRNERIKRNLTAAQLAKRTGKTKNAILEIEKDRSVGQMEKLRDLCLELNVSADYILGIERNEKTLESD